jgi:pyruvate dehydrogenase (quinone)
LVEAVVDPYEPPLPGKIKTEQAVRFAESLARGEPRRMHIATTILEDKVRELV